MYKYQDKSTTKATSNKTPKPFEAGRWDHGGFDQLQSERKYQEDERNDRYRKSRRFQNEDTLASDMLETQPEPAKSRADAGKWTHDKFEENSNNPSAQGSTKLTNEPEKPTKPRIREKRPDRQLYSVRGKRTTGPEETKSERNSVKEEAVSAGKTALLSDEVMRGPATKTVKEPHMYEDDNKSSISNVSTANEEDVLSRREKETQEKTKEGKKEQNEIEPLLEIYLDAEQREVIKVYEQEDNYEKQIEEACQRMGLGKRVSLYLKINVMKAIQEVHPEPQKLDAAVDRLLDFNHRLIMVEEGQEEADETLIPYLEEEDFSDMDLSMEQGDYLDYEEGSY